jgi:hypothetical protein
VLELKKAGCEESQYVTEKGGYEGKGYEGKGYEGKGKRERSNLSNLSLSSIASLLPSYIPEMGKREWALGAAEWKMNDDNRVVLQLGVLRGWR